jgi:hypothetical protein
MPFMKASIHGWVPEAEEAYSLDDRAQSVGCVAKWTTQMPLARVRQPVDNSAWGLRKGAASCDKPRVAAGRR